MNPLVPSKYFPPALSADKDGLLLIGGSLAPEWLLDAYEHGIFPWPIFDNEEILAWWSPDPRAILEFDDLKSSRRLQRTLRTGKFRVTCDADCAGVIHGCATAVGRENETWLLPGMIKAYLKLHELGHVHSVEAWQDGKLAGGVYGVAIGGYFAAESMFYYASDASKVALVYLVAHLRSRGYALLDIQQLTGHTLRMGATEISRPVFLKRLNKALALPVTFGEQLEGSLALQE